MNKVGRVVVVVGGEVTVVVLVRVDVVAGVVDMEPGVDGVRS